MLAYRGVLLPGFWRVSVGLVTERHGHQMALEGLMTTDRTARDVDPRPLLHPLEHTFGLRGAWRFELSQGLAA